MLVRLVVVLALVLALPSSARAGEPTPQARAKAKLHIKKARAAYQAGDYDQAVAEYEVAYKLLPLDDILFNEGQILRVKDDKPAALEAYRRYLEAAPDGAHAEEARGYVQELASATAPPDKPAPRIDENTEKRAVEQAAPAAPAPVAAVVVHKRPSERSSLIRKWWFWTAIVGGAAILAGVTAGAVLGAQQSDPVPTVGVLK